MPIYSFVCDSGHTTDEFFHRPADKPNLIPCPRCRLKAFYSLTATLAGSSVGVVADAPEHFNVSLGRVVKSRRHLNDIRARVRGETGVQLQDYEPIQRDRKHRRSGAHLAKMAGTAAEVPDNLILNRPLAEDRAPAEVLE